MDEKNIIYYSARHRAQGVPMRDGWVTYKRSDGSLQDFLLRIDEGEEHRTIYVRRGYMSKFTAYTSVNKKLSEKTLIVRALRKMFKEN